MRRILFTIPGLDLHIHSFGVFLVLACFGALHLAARRARRESLDPDIIFGLAAWLFLGGLIGARALYLVMHPDQIHTVADLVKFWQGGIVFYGCILGGLIGSIVYWIRRPFPFLAAADAVAPALALGITLGRLGCFFNGCCYGARCELPWAVRFPAGTHPWIQHVRAGLIPASSDWSMPVHPKQLYAALFGLALLAMLVAYYPRRRRDGEVMVLLMIAYPITRFLLEFFRGDAGGLYAGLAISQYISLALGVGGVAAWQWLAHRPASRHADAAAATERTGISPTPGPHSGRRREAGAQIQIK